MKCPRCGRSNPGASWYCAYCGAAFDDLNVADARRGRTRSVLARWFLMAAAVVSLAGAVAVIAVTAWPARAPSGDGPSGTASSAGAPGAGVSSGNDQDAAATSDRGSSATVVARSARTATPRIVTPVPTSRTREAHPSLTAARVVSPKAIDGSLDDWSGEPIRVDQVVFGTDDWDGPSDVSAVAQLAWDYDSLYLAARVTDDSFTQTSTGQQMHLGDSLELQVDTDLDGDWDSGTYNGDDWQIGLSPGDFDALPPEAYVWRPISGPAPTIGVGARQVVGGYVVEAAIPWLLLGVDPRQTRSLGLALNVSDSDHAAPGQDSMVSTSPQRDWSEPRTFNTLTLGDTAFD
ncbi:MAG: sugar-binding protein [Anaerolineae bacterium]